MIYEFSSEKMVEAFEKIPEIEKLVKHIEEVKLKNGAVAQIQLLITINKNEFIPKSGKNFINKN